MKKILVINPFGIGDVLFTTPVLDALKKHYPDSRIYYLCSPKSKSVLENNPAVDEFLFFTRGELKKIKQQSRALYFKTLLSWICRIRAEKFDIVLDLSLVNQYSTLLALLGIKERWGIDYKNRGCCLTRKIKVFGFSDKHVVDYYKDLLDEVGIGGFERKTRFYVSAEDTRWAADFFRGHGIDSGESRVIGLAAFGGESWGEDAVCKQWPLEKFAGLCKKAIERDRVKIIVFGLENDRAAADRLIELAQGGRMMFNAAGKTTIGQLAALMGKCSLFIGNDSGSLHIACALGINTVSVFGPVDEKVYGPVGDNAAHLIASAKVDCRPCYRNFTKPLCQDPKCLNTINEDEVLTLVEDLI